MFQDGEYNRVEMLWGTVNGTTIWDTYQVGEKPKMSSTNSPYREKVINRIVAEKLPNTICAFIYYEDYSMEYVENIKRAYGRTQSRSAQGDTPDF